jgi:hypothetical protein
LIYLLVAFADTQSNAGLFGHLPRWAKPHHVAVDQRRRRRRRLVTRRV